MFPPIATSLLEGHSLTEWNELIEEVNNIIRNPFTRGVVAPVHVNGHTLQEYYALIGEVSNAIHNPVKRVVAAPVHGGYTPHLLNVPNNLNVYNMAATPLKTADVDAMIKQAVKDNDITPDEANDLRVRYKNDPQGLHSIINDHARKRLQYLESLSFPEIDKKDGLAEELIRRDYATYRKKYVAYYGKEPKALDAKVASDKDMQKEINNLESMLVRDGRTTQGQADFIRKGNTNDPNNHLKILHGIANSKREAYENESWDKLDRAGKLEELKTNHLDLFKQKYREKFGKDYQGN